VEGGRGDLVGGRGGEREREREYLARTSRACGPCVVAGKSAQRSYAE
jgi:hypothetical protein